MEWSPDFQTALTEVDYTSAALQGSVDGLNAFIDMPDFDISVFQALGACMVGMSEANNNGGSQSQQCAFNALVSVVTSSAGNIVKILINRIKALGSKSSEFITMFKTYLGQDHKFFNNFGDELAEAGGDLAGAWKTGWNKQKVLDLPKGSRPNPSTYLDQSYIENHIAKFDNGGSYLVPKEALDNYGRNPVGRPDGQFIMTKYDMDDLLQKANGNLSVIETELGIPKDLWKNKELVRIDIPNPQQLNIRIPTGNEGGANELWLPGGRLPNGYSEAVLDAIPQGSYTETLTNIQ